MANRRREDAELENEEVYENHSLFIDTNLDTHLLVSVSDSDSAIDLRKKVMLEHPKCFPNLGEITIHTMKVQRNGQFYHLSESILVHKAYEGVKSGWFLFIDASCLTQLTENEKSCRPNLSDQSPLLCLTYDASASSILKSASAERLRSLKDQPIPGDSCGEFTKDIVTEDKYTSSDILAIENKKSKKKKKTKTKRDVMNLSSSCNHDSAGFSLSVKDGVDDRVKENNIASNNVTGEVLSPSVPANLLVNTERKVRKEKVADVVLDSLCPELAPKILVSENTLVRAEKAERKERYALEENEGLVCTSNTLSPERTDKDHLSTNVTIENKKSKKKTKRKRDVMNLSSSYNHDSAGFPLSVKNGVEDRVKENKIASNNVTGEVLSASVPANLFLDTERKERKQKVADVVLDTLCPELAPGILVSENTLVHAEKAERKERDAWEENKGLVCTSITLSPERTDRDHLGTNVTIENKKSKKEKKTKRDVMNLSSSYNHDSAGFPLSVKDGVEDRVKENNIASNNVTGEVLSPSVPANLLVITEGKEAKQKVANVVVDTLCPELAPGILVSEKTLVHAEKAERKDRDAWEENKGLVCTSITLSPERTDKDHLGTNVTIENKKSKKEKKTKRKRDVMNLSSSNNHDSAGFPLSVKDAVEDRVEQNSIASNNVTDEVLSISVPANSLVHSERKERPKKVVDVVLDTLSPELAHVDLLGTNPVILVSENILVHAEKAERKESDALEENEGLVCTSNTLSPEATDKDYLSTNLAIENKKSKKVKRTKSKKDVMNLSSSYNHDSAGFPLSVKDGVEDRGKENNIDSNNVTDEVLSISVPANLLVNTERKEADVELDTLSPELAVRTNSEILVSENILVYAEKVEREERDAFEENEDFVCTSNTLSPERTDKDNLSSNVATENKKSKKEKKTKTKSDVMDLSSSYNQDSASFPLSVKDRVEDRGKENNIASNNVTGEVLSSSVPATANLLVNTERKELKEKVADVVLEALSPQLGTNPEILVCENILVHAGKAERKGRDALEENKGLVSTSNTLSPEPTDKDHLSTSLAIENKKSKKEKKTKRKRNVMNLSSSYNHDSAGFPLSVKDVVEDSVKENNIASNNVTDEVLSISAPANLLVNTERKERKEKVADVVLDILSPEVAHVEHLGTNPEIVVSENILVHAENALEENKGLVCTSNTLSPEPTDKDHLNTNLAIENKKSKKEKKEKKTKRDLMNLSSSYNQDSAFFPISVKDGVEDRAKENNVDSGNVTGEVLSILGPANLLVNTERKERKEKVADAVLDTLSPELADVEHLGTNHEILVSENILAEKAERKERDALEENMGLVCTSLFPEPTDKDHLSSNVAIENKKSKKEKKTKRDVMDLLSSYNHDSAGFPLSVKDGVGDRVKENNIALNNVTGEVLSPSVPANLLNTEKKEHEEKVADVVLDTLSPEHAAVKQLGTNSGIKDRKKKKKRKMNATFNISSSVVLPSSVQDAGGKESFKENNISSHEYESCPEIVIPANLLVNAEMAECEEITRDPIDGNKVGLNATCTGIGLNLDCKTEQISKIVDSVDVQSADTIKDISRKDETKTDTENQPVVSESGSDRIDFKRYFLPGKAKGADKNGTTRSERDNKTKKKTEKMEASFETSLALQSFENQESVVKSHIKSSVDIEPQESFSKDASSKFLISSKKSSPEVYQVELPSSCDPVQAKTPCSVLQPVVGGVSVSSTPAPAYRKGKKVSPAASSSSSKSFDKSHQGTKRSRGLERKEGGVSTEKPRLQMTLRSSSRNKKDHTQE